MPGARTKFVIGLFALQCAIVSAVCSNARADDNLAVAINAREIVKLHRHAGLPDPLFLRAIANWLEVEFHLPKSEEPPQVRFVSQTTLAALRFGGFRARAGYEFGSRGGTQAAGEHDLVALYEDGTRTIFLEREWTGASPAEISVLVHEMVHHLQNVSGLRYECPEARERPAYAAQQLWLGQFGKNLNTEFSVDSMAVFVRTTCPR